MTGDLLDETLAAIKQAVDIVDVIGEHLTLDRNGATFRGVCPFHDDHKPSLNVDPKFQNYKCWACGAQGDVFKFLQEYLRIPFQEAKERLAERAGIPLKKGRSERNDRRQLLYQALSWAQKHFENCLWAGGLGAVARQYLGDRGLTEETARRYGLGFAPDSFERLVHAAKQENLKPEVLRAAGLTKTGKRGTDYDLFRGRLMFPVREDRYGRIVGFGGRILPEIEKNSDREAGPKYLNTPATPVYNKSTILYGLDTAAGALLAQRQARKPGQPSEPRRLIVMEGYTDCLMAYQFGLEIAVATCGTALTEEHVRKLRSQADQVILMFDGDAAGQKAAREATRLFLRSELDLRLCVLPDGFDPCDFLLQRGKDAFEEQITGSVDAIEYQITSACARHDVTRITGQLAAVEEVLSVLAEVPVLTDASHRTKMELTLRRLTERFGVREEELRNQLGQIRAKSRRSGPVGASNRQGPVSRDGDAGERFSASPDQGPRQRSGQGAPQGTRNPGRPMSGPPAQGGFPQNERMRAPEMDGPPRDSDWRPELSGEPVFDESIGEGFDPGNEVSPFAQDRGPDEMRAAGSSNRTGGFGAAPMDAGFDEKMDPRERQVVQLLVVVPQSAPQIREFFPEDEVRHPLLRQLTKIVYAFADQHGEEASVELLRESLSSDESDERPNRLGDLALELSASAPEEGSHDQWLQDVRTGLMRRRQREKAGRESRRLLAGADQEQHLEFLRQYRDRTRPDNQPCA